MSTNATTATPRAPFTIGFDDPLPPHRSAAYGLQHLLALTGLWVFPTSLGAAVGLGTEDVAKIIQGCFLLTGVVTILSSSRILKLPIVQGPTAALLVALITAGGAYGIDVAFGSMIVAGLLSLVLAFPLFKLGLYGHVARFIANPLVFGTMFLVLGAQLASIGVSGWFTGIGGAGVGAGVVVAVCAAAAVAACMIFGGSTIVKRLSILIGVAVGTVVAAAIGAWTFPDLSAFPVLGVPQPAPFGLGFAWGAVPIMMVGFMQAAGESMGVYALLGRWSGQRIDVDRANRGLFVEFLGSAVGGLFGGIGSTSYPENSGILRVSGIASRSVTIAAGAISVVLAFLPQLALFLANLPGPALSAAATILFGVITISGVQQLRNVQWDDLNLFVAAVCFIVPIGLQAMPAEVVDAMSPTISGILTSPMMMSTIMLIVLYPLVDLVLRPLLGRRLPEEPELDLEAAA